VTLSRGLQPEEIREALGALSAEVERDGPIGLTAAGRQLDWPHLRFHALTFERLGLVDGPAGDGTGAGKGQARAAELWIGLARAALATDRPGEAPELLSTDPSNVARAIDEHESASAYDQVIVGYLLQIAHELKSAAGAEGAALRRRTARLIAALKPETLRRLLAMGGDAAQRHEFVLNAASGMAVDAVVEILKAAADASGQTISHGLTRLLAKLAEHAEEGPELVRPLAAGALREQVGRLLSGWHLADPNPDAYGKVLQHLATTPVRRTEAGAGPLVEADDPLRIVQMGLEVGGGGPLLDRAIDHLIRDGRCQAILGLLGSRPGGCMAAANHVLARMAAPGSIALLAAQEPLDRHALDHLFPAISLEGYAALLDALAASRNRSTRRKLLDRLAATTLDVGPLIVARLEDDRWYVVRNMLVLLQRIGRLPPGFSPARWTEHPDARVRCEAIHLQLTLPAERDLAVTAALDDADLRIRRAGLTAVQRECPSLVTPLVAAVAVDSRVIEELRVLAVRALGRSDDPRARDTLLHLVDGGRTLLGRPRLAAATPVSVAALRALADGWRRDPAGAAVLALAGTSSDPGLRQAAMREAT
jgi:hypothetical protein